MQQQHHGVTEDALTLEQLAPVSFLPLHQTFYTGKRLWYISQQSNLSRQSANHAGILISTGLLGVSQSHVNIAPVDAGE